MTRRLKIGLAAVGTLVLLGLGSGVYLAFQYLDWVPAAKELTAAEAKARAIGLPLSASDLAPKPRITEADNAAPALRRMIEAMDAVPKWKARATELDTVMASGDFTKARKAVANFEPAVRHAEAAAAKAGVDFGRDWDMGTQVLFPEYAYVRTIARVLGAKARLQAMDGDANGALASLRTQRKLGELVGSEPILIGMLVEISIRQFAQAAAQQLAALWKDDDRKLARLEAALADRDPLPSYEQAMCGEVYLGVATIRNLDLMSSDPHEPKEVDPAQLRRTGMPTDTGKRAYMARHLQTWTEAWPIIQGHAKDPLAATRDLQAFEERLESKKGLSYTLLSFLFPVFSQAGYSVVSIDAKERVTVELVRAMRHRLKTGRYPEAITTKDPFDGKPLRMKVDGEKIRIYSIGRNFVDDGGRVPKELPRNAENKVGDDVAAYPPLNRNP